MSKKQDAFYFENFVECADCAVRAAKMLQSILNDFHPEKLKKELDLLHAIENEADGKKHELVAALTRAFITPIEQEDILALSNNIDDITDTVEDVLFSIYMCNVQEIREDALTFADLVVRTCERVKMMMEEFKDFKKSKKLKEHIIAINDLEEEGDRLNIESNRRLYTNGTDAVSLIAWREIYRYFELCLDTCEHAADVVEVAMMKNI